MTINILGTSYEVRIIPYDQEKLFQKLCAGGVCNQVQKQILLCDMNTFPGYDIWDEDYIRTYMNEVARHELIHAFLIESGLGENASGSFDSWATNEEMVDWMAIQLPKICKASEIIQNYVQNELDEIYIKNKSSDEIDNINKIASLIKGEDLK